jgi:hypothetical protein
MNNAQGTKPIRLRLSRRKGYRMQAVSRAANGLAAVKVDRATGWGNPFLVETMGRENAVDAFRRLVTGKMSETELRKHSGVGPGWEERRTELRRAGEAIRAGLLELRSHNLACWCKENEACHADVLLELANKAN